jgi:serine/threonine protein kinase
VCQALAHAHGRGVVHRDRKPGNVWLDNEGNASLGDFGLAIAIDRSRMTMQGMMVGTVASMAPGAGAGRTPDARTDLYALGAMLYEMMTGCSPYLGDEAVGVISQHINTPPPDVVRRAQRTAPRTAAPPNRGIIRAAVRQRRRRAPARAGAPLLPGRAGR